MSIGHCGNREERVTDVHRKGVGQGTFLERYSGMVAISSSLLNFAYQT